MTIPYSKLKEDVKVLRFVNRETGYNLDIRYILNKKYCAEKVLDSPLIRIGLNGLVWAGASATAFGAAMMGERLVGKYGFFAGAIVGGMGAGVTLDYVLFMRWTKYLGFVNRSRELMEIFDSEGIKGLDKRGIGFDDLDFDLIPDYVGTSSKRV